MDVYFTVNKDNDTDQTAWLHRLFGANVFSRVTKSGFLVAHIVENQPNDINIIHFALTLYICETPERVFFANREDPDEMLHFIRVFNVCNGKLSSDKRIQYILKITTCQWPVIYNGLTQVYCIKPEGRLHYY